ncbi:hypothetical protein ACFWQC_01770 [Nocardioides sp. NPDC058538]|uniref:hypothetical protein n=1 Tax=Nocardioides sp. NPDC058538 TaxID=3346542 RepID=UPI003668B178
MLEGFDPTCASLYRRAIDTFSEDPLEVSALVVGGHCLRELVNRISRLIDTDPQQATDVNNDALKGFVSAWTVGRVALSTAVAAAAAGTSSSIEVDPDTAETALQAGSELVRSEHARTMRSMGRRSILAVGHHGEGDNPTVKRLKKAIDAFERFRHPGGNTSGWPSNFEALRSDLEIIESAIEGRIGSFFDIAHRLQAVLAEANQRDAETGDFDAPDKALFERAFAYLGDHQHRRVFYDGLRNPKWIEALDSLGAFALPPQTDELDIWPPYAPGPYLVRVATVAPDAVCSVLVKLLTSTSPARREVIAICLKAIEEMPDEVAARLAKPLSAAKLPSYDPNVGTAMAKLAERLGEAGFNKKARALVNPLLAPREQKGHYRSSVVAGIETHWYREALDCFARGCRSDPRLLNTLVAWLDTAATIEGLTTDGGHDLSSIHRPSIRTAGDGLLGDRIIDDLIDVVRDVTVEALRSGRDAEEVLAVGERSPHPLLRRIAWQSLATVALDVEGVRAAATDRLIDRDSVDAQGCATEWVELAKALLPFLSESQYVRWERMVLAGPPDVMKVRARLREHLQPGESEDEAWTAYVERWQLDRLGNVGHAQLHGESQALLQRLVERWGEPRAMGSASFVVRAAGDDSDAGPDFSGVDASAVLDYVIDHQHDEHDPWKPQSFDMGQNLATAVANRPAEFLALSDQVANLRPTYFNRIIDGLRQSVDAGESLDWDVVVATLHIRASSAEESANAQTIDAETHDDGQDARHGTVSALHLIEAGLRRETSGFAVADIETALAFTLALIRLMPSTHVEQSVESEIDVETSIQAALNTVVPAAVTTSAWLLHFAHHRTYAGLDKVRPQVTTAYDLLFDPVRVEDPAIAAAFGMAFGLLYDAANDWLCACVDRVLSADAYGDTVVEVALRWHSRARGFLDVMSTKLAEWFDRAAGGEDVGGGSDRDSPLVRVGVELLVGVIEGDRERSDLLVNQFVDMVGSKVMREVLQEIGYMLRQTKNMPEAIRERAQALWDAQLASAVASGDSSKLASFSAWVESGAFPVEWWLPRLGSVLDMIDVEGRVVLGETLADAARHDPRRALDVLRRLIESTEESWARYDLVRHAPAVIARAKAVGDTTLAEQAALLTDSLGRLGYIDIDRQVDEAVAALTYEE